MRAKGAVFVLTLLMIGMAQPAAAQVQVLGIDQNVPLAATLDNPCTSELEAIAFSGAVHLVQEVWLMPDSRLRLIVQEETRLHGENTAVLPPATSPRYSVAGSSKSDVEFAPGAASLMSYKKVVNDVAEDNFHAVLVLAFDPTTYRLDLRLEGACSSGEVEE